VDIRPRHFLDICAGCGGLGLGVQIAEPRSRCVGYVEREAYAAAILGARMEAGDLDSAPIWTDVATFDARAWRGAVDWVLSGDPCQPNSVASAAWGKGFGAEDERFLITEVVRIFADSGANRLFRENVTGNAEGQLAAIVPLLERLGCRVAAGIFSASETGAPHDRERLFIMADASGDGLQGGTLASDDQPPGCREQPGGKASRAFGQNHGSRNPWEHESGLGRVAYGIANRVDRLRTIGNGAVPLAAAYAWRTLDALLAEGRGAGPVILEARAA
jgi:DNA (cytosine-5)-methyltransferase 1